jgi:organic hydroperoxide reductase OsmC/OhrA
VPATGEHLVARVVGEVELEDKILVVRRIHVKLELKVAAEHREVAERVHGFFAMSCPLYRTLRSAIAITTELAFTAA